MEDQQGSQNLYSGAKHIPLSLQRPFHFHHYVGTLFHSDQTNTIQGMIKTLFPPLQKSLLCFSQSYCSSSCSDNSVKCNWQNVDRSRCHCQLLSIPGWSSNQQVKILALLSVFWQAIVYFWFFMHFFLFLPVKHRS